MTDTVSQIWQHRTSGELFAIEIGECVVTGAAGPLSYSEHAAVRVGDWTSDPKMADDINADQDSYLLFEGDEDDAEPGGANAHLIAAAPDLLGWLRKAVQMAGQQDRGGEDVPMQRSWAWLAENAGKAIAKAEGGTHHGQ